MKIRIDVAYCVELNRTVDIQEACQEFADQQEHKKFHFLCSDPACRNSKVDGVRVIGVNHYKSPEEQEVSNSAHYRVQDEHINTCEWMELDAALREEDKSEEAESNKHRKRLRKITRLITRFVIPDDATNETSNTVNNELARIRNITDQITRRKELRSYASGVGSTATNLESLVSCYEELKDEKALDEEFSVQGYGKISFRNAFRHITLGATKDFAVYHAGARFHKGYGKGFSLAFIDQVEGKSTSFYVSSADVKKYRSSARLLRTIEDLKINQDRRPYLRVYWLGDLSDTEKGYNATFATLAHVVLRLIYPSTNP